MAPIVMRGTAGVIRVYGSAGQIIELPASSYVLGDSVSRPPFWRRPRKGARNAANRVLVRGPNGSQWTV